MAGAPLVAPWPCPECGGTLAVDDVQASLLVAPTFYVRQHGLEQLRRVLVTVPAACCTACEFVLEIRP